LNSFHDATNGLKPLEYALLTRGSSDTRRLLAHSSQTRAISLDAEVIIVGAGVSGLTAAWQLKKRGISYLLVEARNRTGGRIFSPSAYTSDYDLGPSWIWPGQHNVAQLLSELKLETFDQPVGGATLYQLQSGEIQQHQGLSPMAGAYRIVGGSAALTNALTELLQTDNTFYLEHECTSIEANETGVTVYATHQNSTIQWQATSVVMAIPPRLATRLQYNPPLSSELNSALTQLPTWMAAHAKIVTLFDKPFWQEQGLSGSAISQIGPMVEIHDASPSTTQADQPAALFGFVGYPADARAQIGEDELINRAKQQLIGLFGEAASKPVDVILQDWSQEPFTAHPAYGLTQDPQAQWTDRLHFISAETNHDNGGLIEGAVDRALKISQKLSHTSTTAR